MQGQICDILRPQLAMNRFLPLWPNRFSHFVYIHLGEGAWGGSDIRSMSSIRPICKCRCPPLATGSSLRLVLYPNPLYLEVVATPTRSPTRQPRATGSSLRLVLYPYPLYLEVVATPTRSPTRQPRATGSSLRLVLYPYPLYLEVVATPMGSPTRQPRAKRSPTRQPRALRSSLQMELYSYPLP